MDMDTVMATATLRNVRHLPTLAVAITSLFHFNANAQQAVPGAVSVPTSTAATAAPVSTGSGESNAESARTWIIKPRVSLTETLTDRANVGSTAGTDRSDLITTLAPGINIKANTARFKGNLDYTLRALFYANNSDFNTTQNQLNAFGSFEAVENWFFVDFNGRISQQAISSFGAASPSTGTINRNMVETSNFGISPYIRGRFGSSMNYLLRYNQSTTQSSGGSTLSNVDINQWVGQLQGGTAFRNLSWGLDLNQQNVNYANGRQTEATIFRGIATYALFPEFRISLSAGSESNDYASAEQTSRTTHGYGFDWTPTERTKLSVFRERRFFGNGNNYSFTHRFPRSSISYSDTRDVSVLPNQFSSLNSVGSTYDLFYPLLAQICTSTLGNTVGQAAIDQCVSDRFASLNLPANYQTTSSFLTSRATLMRRQQLAWTLHGVRNTLTIMASRSENETMLASAALNDDFSNLALTTIKQRGLSANLSHKLSAQSNLSFMASRQDSEGSGTTTNLKTTMTMYQASLTTQLGSKTNGSISLRHAEFDSTTNPYTENAVIGTLNYTY